MQVVFALSQARRRQLTERTLGCRVHLFVSEAELLRAALEYVKQQDPDALVLFQASEAQPLAQRQPCSIMPLLAPGRSMCSLNDCSPSRGVSKSKQCSPWR